MFITLLLFCAEQSVARIAETGKDISVLVKATVKRGNENVHVGVRFRNARNTLGCADDRHKLNVLTAALL